MNRGAEGDTFWDAYEAGEGRSLRELFAHPVPWSVFRRWLFDLGIELLAIADRNSDPVHGREFDLSQVWISSDGRAQVCEFQISDPMPTGKRVEGVSEVQAILAHLCREWGLKRAVNGLEHPIPLHATELLQRLERQKYRSPEALLRDLENVQSLPLVVTRATRAKHLAACAAPTFCFALMGVPQTFWSSRRAGPIEAATLLQLVLLIYGVWSVTGVISGGLFHGVGLRWAGIVPVGSDGSPLTTPRAILRSVLACLPGLMFLLVSYVSPPLANNPILTSTLLTTVGLGVGFALHHPGRGLQDYLASTYLVPR